MQMILNENYYDLFYDLRYLREVSRLPKDGYCCPVNKRLSHYPSSQQDNDHWVQPGISVIILLNSTFTSQIRFCLLTCYMSATWIYPGLHLGYSVTFCRLCKTLWKSLRHSLSIRENKKIFNFFKSPVRFSLFWLKTKNPQNSSQNE